MYRKLFFCLGLFIAGFATSSWLSSRQIKPTPSVLSLESTVVPTLSPTPTLEPTPTIKPTPKPTHIPPTPIPTSAYSSEQIYGFTEKFAQEYGVDANVLRHIALCETDFKPTATNYVYAGLYQFDAPTWASFRRKMNISSDANLRFDAQEAVRTAAYVLSLGRGSIWPNCYPH